MDHQSLNNVLGILRLMRAAPSNQQTFTLLQAWAGSDAAPATVLRVAAYLQEQIKSAQTVIDNSQLSRDAKEGIQSVLKALEDTFSLDNLYARVGERVGNIAGAISNFAILLSASGIGDTPEQPSEAMELVKEVEAMISAFDDPGLDPVVRGTAKRHLKILSTLLQHVPIFGLEAALTTYFELMMKVRRADINTSEDSKSKFSPLWTKMETWAGRLSTLDKLWNSGARLLGHAGRAQDLLAYLPDTLTPPN